MACQSRQAIDLANETRRGRRAVGELVEYEEPEGFPVDSGVWDVPWLADLRDLPPEAVWPRFMSLPHPRAVASLGVEFEAHVASRGHRLRWWQRLVTRRLLEVDAEGRLVWDTLLLTLARQVGKSWWLRELLFWRIHQGDRFGGQQGALHIARVLTAARKEFVKVARELAGREDEYGVLITKTHEEIRWRGDDSAWVVRTVQGAYGETAGLVVVDEAWDVEESDVDEGIDPTRVSVPQSQMLLVSTAHRRAKALMRRRRQAALEAIAAGRVEDDEIIIEWSTPRSYAIDDPDGWRLASPHWDAQRERLIRKNAKRVLTSGSTDDDDEADPVEYLRGQWLNQWPLVAVGSQRRIGPLFDQATWKAATADADAVGELVLAVEDRDGHGAAAAAAGITADGRITLGGWCFDTRAEAYTWARRAAEFSPGSRLLVGQTLVDDQAVLEMPVASVIPRGAADTRSALSLLRELVSSGRAVHDGSPDIAEHLPPARVAPANGGGLTLAVLNPGRLDLVRAVAWVVAEAERQGALVPTVHGGN